LTFYSQYQSSPLFIKDKTYNKIISHLDEFINGISEKDKQILLQTNSKCYLKYEDLIIKGNQNSISELNITLLMTTLANYQNNRL
jgi:hypothetical protein